ncbi:MAG: glycoside hydrolase [Fibrobacteraceae bacterium]|nr:glycoside hydrolase [Fibrobacteraceae bacterium]
MTKTTKTAVKKAASAPAKKATKCASKETACKSAAKAAPKKAAVSKTTAQKTAAKTAIKAAPKKAAVEFVADCPLATTVSVAGSFNNWVVDKDMLKKDKKSGKWSVKINLLPGDYEYKFVCDGKNWDEGDNKIKHV